MRQTLLLSVLALTLTALPAAAQTSSMSAPAPGMAALKYYVGTWSCLAGPPGVPPSKATVTYAMDHDILRQYVIVPPAGNMKQTFSMAVGTGFDAKKNRYVQTSVDNSGNWGITYAKPWTGNTEQWVDSTTSDGKPGHGVTVRSKNSFTYTGFATLTGTKPAFKVTCTRSA